jgi:hypothetical protein
MAFPDTAPRPRPPQIQTGRALCRIGAQGGQGGILAAELLQCPRDKSPQFLVIHCGDAVEIEGPSGCFKPCQPPREVHVATPNTLCSRSLSAKLTGSPSKAAFREVWERFYPSLTPHDVEHWHHRDAAAAQTTK